MYFKNLIELEFEYLDWFCLTGFKQCASSIVFKYFNDQCTNYLHKVQMASDVVTESNFQLTVKIKWKNIKKWNKMSISLS